jgi:hypothetical protein
LAVHPIFLTGPKFGLSEQRWNTLMTKAIRLLKRLGIR